MAKSTTNNVRGSFNLSQGGEMTATSDVTPMFKYRTNDDGSAAFRVATASLSGTWVGTVTLQSSPPDIAQWDAVPGAVYTANMRANIELGGSMDYRWIFTSRTSGTAIGWITC